MDWDFIITGDGPRPFKCPSCQEEFEWAIQLQQHRPSVDLRPAPPPTPTPSPTPSPTPRQLSSRQIFRCAHCPAAYLTKFGLNVHFNDVHRQRFRCPHCPKSFLVKTNCKRHVNTVHLDAGHKCPFPGCRHSSPTATVAKLHLIVHSNAKDFVCRSCHKTYKHGTSLRKHVRKVHEGHDVDDDDDEVQIIEEEEELVPKIISVVSLSEQSKSC